VNGRIGIIIGRPYYTINLPQLKGILRECFRSGRSACVFTLNEEFYDAHVFRQEWNVLHAVSFEELSGVIYLPYSIAKDETKSRITELLKSRCKCPVTVVTADRVPWPSVWFDEKSQFASVVTHLIESHGCRDILCLTGPPQMQTSRSRVQGWQEALTAAGLPAPPERVVYGDFWEDSPRELARELTDGTRTMPDAVVCGNDRMAVTLCDSLAEAGVRVPEDVIVTGFDGIEEAELHNPAITTCMPDWELLGETAAKKLIALIEGRVPESGAPPGHRLIFGESCGHSRPRTIREALRFNTLEARYMDTAINTLSLSDENAAGLMNSIYNTTYFYASTNYPDKAEFAVCLCTDWNRTSFSNESELYRTEGCTETMLHMLRDGTGAPFSLRRMMPEEWENQAPSAVFFVPLYFRDRCFGYTLLRFDGVADSYDIYYLKFCREVGSALAFFCLRNDYRSFAYRNYIRDCRDDLTGLYFFRRSRQICERTIDFARLYGETLYLLVLHIRGLRQLEDAMNRLEKDKVLLGTSDILVGSCRGQEQVFIAEEGTFFIIGSGIQPRERAENLREQITGQFRTSSIGHQDIVWLSSAVRLIDTAGLSGFSEVEEVLRQMREDLKHEQQPSMQEKKHRLRLNQLREDIYTHPEHDWTVAKCALELSVSQSYFLKLYRGCFGTSCSRDIQCSKLAYAKKLLLQTDMILQDIAYECGYDYSHFMRLFRQETGTTPTAYRKGAAPDGSPVKDKEQTHD